MDENELRRLEDKMKVAHLQIDKRLSTLEENYDDSRKGLHNVTEEIISLKSRQDKVAANMGAAEKAIREIKDISNQFRELRRAFGEMSSKFRSMPQPSGSMKPDIDVMSERLAETEKSIAATNSSVESMLDRLAEIAGMEKKLDAINHRITVLERQVALSSPVIMD